MRKSIALSIAVLALVAIAQTTGNKLTITVQDEQGQTLANASVVVLDSTNKVLASGNSVKTSLIFSLPDNTQSIRVKVTLPGYQVRDTSFQLTGTSTSVTIRLIKGIPPPELEVVEEDAVPVHQVVKSTSSSGSKFSFSGNRTTSLPLKARELHMVTHYDRYQPASGADAGKLTAGEIHDFSKWELWKDMDSTQLFQYKNRWQLHPGKRFTYQLTNRNGFPIIDRPVYLMKNEDTLWQARTDNTGKAELWDMRTVSRESKQEEEDGLTIRIYDPSGDMQANKKATPFDQGILNQRIDASCEVSNLAEIAFVVDATGSMQDEIDYLKQDLLNIVDEMASLAGGMDVKTGAVFYKCIGENYVTQTSPLTRNLGLTREFVQNHNAGGGGLEAVEEALQTALDSLQWSENARNRIMFLVLDEPPGYTAAVLARLHHNVRRAAKMGIRIIPVVSSGVYTGSDQSLEYLMRSMALLTNGTYVFLTDDSGIGNKHTAPTTDSYKTEKLNEIFRRLIGQYTFVPVCPEPMVTDRRWTLPGIHQRDSTTLTDSSYPEVPKPFHFDTASVTDNWVVYPVPTTGAITIEPPEFAHSIYLTDLSGKLLLRASGQEVKSVVKWDIGRFAEGIYFVRAEGTDRMETRRIILAR